MTSVYHGLTIARRDTLSPILISDLSPQDEADRLGPTTSAAVAAASPLAVYRVSRPERRRARDKGHAQPRNDLPIRNAAPAILAAIAK
jgi:hypothetical protein